MVAGAREAAEAEEGESEGGVRAVGTARRGAREAAEAGLRDDARDTDELG